MSDDAGNPLTWTSEDDRNYRERKELKDAILKMHKLYYNPSMLKDPEIYLEFHRSLQPLFDFAGITSTLSENNPNQVSPEQVEFAIKQGWLKRKN